MTNKANWLDFNDAADPEEDFEGCLAFNDAAEGLEVNDAPDQNEALASISPKAIKPTTSGPQQALGRI